MGSGKGGVSTQQQQSQVTIPPEVLGRYNELWGRGENAANQNFQTYGGQFVAPLTATQNQAIGNINSAQNIFPGYAEYAGNQIASAPGVAAPFNQAAAGLIPASINASDPLSGSDINQYMSPYIGNVVDSTTNWLNQQNAQQRTALNSNAISQGAFGGNRTGLAQAALAGQQNISEAPTIAGLYNQGYSQALGAAQQQQAQRVGALQRGSQLAAGLGQQEFGQNIAGAQAYSGLGTQYLQNQLGQAQAELGAGTLEQQTAQAGNQALYNQFLQQQAYPFQTTQFLSNLATGTGPLYGSTTLASGSSFQPQPFFSDDKLKEDVRTIGHTKEGLRIIRYKLKDDPDKLLRIGFLASDVENKMPEAVTRHAGVRAVDYDRAARAAGGLVGYADGGSPYGGYNPQDMAQILAMAQQAMYPGAAGRQGIGGTGPRGMQISEGGSHPQLPKPELLRWSDKQPEPELKQLSDDVNTMGKTADTVGQAYTGGKDALFGSAASTDKNGKWTPGTGGLIGRNGSPDWDNGWLGRNMPSFSGWGGGSGSGSGSITTEPLPPPDQQAQGGRIHRLHGGGLSADIPYDEGGGYIPDKDVHRDPAQVLAEQEKLKGNGPMGTASGSQGTGFSNLLGTANSVAGLASKFGKLGDMFGGLGGSGGASGAPGGAGGIGDVAGADAVGGSGGSVADAIPMLAEAAARGGRAGLAAGGHANEWMQIPGEIIGTAIGAYFGGPWGGMAGGRAGKDVGTTVGDAFGGNWDGVGNDVENEIGQALNSSPMARGGLVPDQHAEVVRRARHAIGQIESSNRYDAVGSATGNDRPYGRYQVMGSNIPSWTREALGKSMTPEQFLRDSEAQDQVFDHHFGKALQQHGSPEDAASVWFSGRPLHQTHGERDVLGTSVPDYISKFSRFMGEGNGEGPREGLVPSRASMDEPIRPDIQTTARVLNELGYERGGRAGFDTGGGADDDVMRTTSGPTIDRQVAQLPTPTVPPPPPKQQTASLVPPNPPPSVPLPSQPSTPDPGLVASRQGYATAATNSDPNAGFLEPGGWMDRNERPIVSGLAALGSMLASPSRTLAGAVGQGIATGAQTWPSWGFKQKALNIEQQNSDTVRLGKLQEQIGLQAAMKARQQQLNPSASTAVYDETIKGLMAAMGNMLKVPSMANTPVGGNYEQYVGSLPAETQALVKKLNTVDNPWLLESLANSPGIPELTRNEYLRLRDSAIERLRLGQARDTNGTNIVNMQPLTDAAMRLETARSSAQSTGYKLTPDAEIAAKQAQVNKLLQESGKSEIRFLPEAQRAEAERIDAEIQILRGRIAPVTPVRRHGGRVGYQDGGTLPSYATDQNDPRFWEGRSKSYGAMGLAPQSDEASKTARELTLRRLESGMRPTSTGETEQQPGAITTMQQRAAAEEMVKQNSSLNDELFQRAQTGNQALQMTKELRNAMFDEHGNPTSSMGPFNETLNRGAAIFKQLGVPDSVLSAFNVDPANAEAVRKAQASIAAAIAHGDLGRNIHQGQFNTFMESATPNMGIMPKAAQFIIDHVLIPRAQQEVDAYGSIKDLPPTVSHRKAYREWMLEHPWYSGARIEKDQAPDGQGQPREAPPAPPIGERVKNQWYNTPEKGIKRWLGDGRWSDQ